MSHTLPEIIGVMLSMCVLVVIFFTVYEVLRAIIISLWHDFKSWRKKRNMPQPWQPRKRPMTAFRRLL